MKSLPGGELAKRFLECFFVIDVSSSMADNGKIQAVNYGMRETIPEMHAEVRKNPSLEVHVQVLTFANAVSWLYPEPVRLEDFQWSDLTVNGSTELGLALSDLTGHLDRVPEGSQRYPVVLILISDGQPTNGVRPDFQSGLAQLLSHPLGAKSVRFAVSVGSDANESVLRQFVSDQDRGFLYVKDSADLAKAISFTTSSAIAQSSRAVSTPLSMGSAASSVFSIAGPGSHSHVTKAGRI